MDEIVAYARTVLFFLLFVNIVMQLLKGSSYERFVHPVCGMILVIMIVRPLLGLFGGEEKVLYAAEQKISLLLARSESEPGVVQAPGYEFVVLESFEQELVAQLSRRLEQEGLQVVTADFSLSAETKDFGTIRGLTVTAESKKAGEKRGFHIAPIVFENRKREPSVSAEEIRIKDMLADFYQIDEANIYVNIKEDSDG